MQENSTHSRSPLRGKRGRFVAEYLRDRNGAQAAIRAGYSQRTARTIASELLTFPDVRAEMRRMEDGHLARVEAECGVTLEMTVRELAKGAFFDVRNLFNADGSPKAINELDDITAAAIEGVEVVEQFIGSGEDRVHIGTVKKYKLARRTASLDMLMKHLNGYKAENDAKGAATANALLTLLGDMRRSSLPVVQQVDDDHGV